MSTGEADPTTIEAIVVTADDVVAALEARHRNRRDAVLRVTPPFAARMRARLHLAGAEGEYDEPEPIHIEPGDLVENVPPFPGTGAERWRRRVRQSLVETVEIKTDRGPHAVRVLPLGGP